MSDLQDKEVACRKNHQCGWCGQIIKSGNKAQYRAYTFDGDFVSEWQHPECYTAMCESDSIDLQNGWCPGDNARPTALQQEQGDG